VIEARLQAPPNGLPGSEIEKIAPAFRTIDALRA